MSPLDLHVALLELAVKDLKVLFVLHRLLGLSPPVVGLPVVDPHGDGVDEEEAVGVDVQLDDLQLSSLNDR